VDPVLGREVVEGQQLLEVVGDLRDGLTELRAVGALNAVIASRAWRRSSAFQISARAFFAPGCADFGSAPSTLAILWNQQRCSRAVGNTSRSALQNPSAPSPTASTGADIPRRAQSRSRSAQDSTDSR
jgi:hypothetical protein